MTSAGLHSTVTSLIAAAYDVEGWLSDGAIGLFALLDEIQKSNAVHGDLFEIGCHHGKSAIVLALLAERERERLSVCDVFDNQSHNVSRSGRGNRDVFLGNLQSVFGETAFVRILERRSQDLSAAETGADHRLFHIDGGHTVEEVRADLELAAACIGERGAIVCDDALHPGWPTVAEAIFGFLFAQEGAILPVAVGFNKMVLVPAGSRDMYADWLESSERCWQFIPRDETRGIRWLELCGQQTACFIPRVWEGVNSGDQWQK